MPHRVRGSVGPQGEDTTYVYSRAEDRSWWAKSSAFVEKYKVLFGAILAVAVAAGFGWRTPAQTFGEMHQKIDHVQREVDTLKLHEEVAKIQAADDRREISQKIDQLIRFRCLDSDPRDLAMAGVDCSSVEGIRRNKQR